MNEDNLQNSQEELPDEKQAPMQPAADPGQKENARPTKKKRSFFSRTSHEESAKGTPESDQTDEHADTQPETIADAEPDTINDLEQKLAEANDKFLRLFSDFDNYRKRTARERIEMAKTASSDLIIQLIPVVDDFERALKSMGNADEATLPIRQGVELIYNKLWSILERQGVKPIEAMGHEFNTDFHEALTNIPAPDETMKGKVIDQVEKGYLLGDKVIRFAKVVVGA